MTKGCFPCIGCRDSTHVTTAFAGSTTTIDMGELMATAGAFVVFQDLGAGQYTYLTLEGRCIWQKSTEAPQSLLARMRPTLLIEAGDRPRVVVAEPSLAGYAHNLSELAGRHREYIKTSTTGVGVGLVCTLTAPDLIALARSMQEDRLAARLPLERRFACFDTPHPNWRSLREIGVFFCSDHLLRYTPLTRSVECHSGSRVVCNRRDEALMYDAEHDKWSRGRCEDGEAFARGACEEEQPAHVVRLDMPVVLYSNTTARFLDGGVLSSAKRQQLRRASTLNRCYKPTELRVGMPCSLFKHAHGVTLCAVAGCRIVPFWSSERDPGLSDTEAAAVAWLRRV